MFRSLPTTGTAGAALLAVALVGCGSVTDRVAERALEEVVQRASDDTVEVDLSDGELSVEFEDGTELTQGPSTEVPAEIAAALELPDGFEAMSVVRNADGDGGIAGITLTGMVEGMTREAVRAAFEGALGAAGWDLEEAPEGVLDELLMPGFAWRDADGFVFAVLSDDEGDGPHAVSLTLIPDGAGR